jgi:hypothetical protein
MDWIKKRVVYVGVSILLVALLVSCSVRYSFTGGAIDYNRVKTISIADFPIKSEYVYAPLGTRFNDGLKDVFVRQTRLRLVNSNADLELEGEITGYNQYNESVAADGFASKTRLTITVNVRYTDNSDHENDIEGQQFSAFRTYESTQLLTAVQDPLIDEMVKEITDQIFNATVANW